MSSSTTSSMAGSTTSSMASSMAGSTTGSATVSMARPAHEFDRYGDVCLALADPCLVPVPADLAPFTRDDLDEAHSRLGRLAGIWANRLGALTTEQLDRSPGAGWTFRQIAFHLAGSTYYADAVGDLTPTEDGQTRD